MPIRPRSWTELSRISDFYDRYNYLRLRGAVGQPTFGSERYINQNFYTSKQWRDVRHEVIARDLGCDLGVEGFEKIIAIKKILPTAELVARLKAEYEAARSELCKG